jgi:hypothetical protein
VGGHRPGRLARRGARRPAHGPGAGLLPEGSLVADPRPPRRRGGGTGGVGVGVPLLSRHAVHLTTGAYTGHRARPRTLTMPRSPRPSVKWLMTRLPPSWNDARTASASRQRYASTTSPVQRHAASLDAVDAWAGVLARTRPRPGSDVNAGDAGAAATRAATRYSIAGRLSWCRRDGCRVADARTYAASARGGEGLCGLAASSVCALTALMPLAGTCGVTRPAPRQRVPFPQPPATARPPPWGQGSAAAGPDAAARR